MSNITPIRAESGLMNAEVVGRKHITPHMMRVTVAGDDLRRFEYRGYDQWFRLAIPISDESRFDNLPQNFALSGYLKYLTLPKATRPVIRNYTLREWRAEDLELDIDFVVHGMSGVAGPWSTQVEPGTPIGLIDQGCGFDVTSALAAARVLLVGDESALPAIVGILRDLPRDVVGHAIIEIPDIDDAQPTNPPEGVAVHWVPRASAAAPGAAALAHLQSLPWSVDGIPYLFAAGESSLATGARRWFVNEQGVPKSQVTFCGYWKRARTH